MCLVAKPLNRSEAKVDIVTRAFQRKPMSTWHGVVADEDRLSRCKMSTDTVYNTLKTHTKYAHIVRGTPTLRDI